MVTTKQQQPRGYSIEAKKNRSKRGRVLEEANGCCFYCGCPVSEFGYHSVRDWILLKDVGMVLEHKLPTIRGGSDVPSNIACSCRDCNSKKGTFTVEEFRLLSALRVADLNFHFAGEHSALTQRDWLVCHSSEVFERQLLIHNIPSAKQAYDLRNGFARGPRGARRT